MIRFLILIFCFSTLYSFSEDETKLQKCFGTCWGVDSATNRYLCKAFKPFLENTNGSSLISDFINKSMKMNTDFTRDKEVVCLPHDDGVICASKFHLVVFENPFVRILKGSASPGEREPFHTHVWKSLLVVFEEATYLVEYTNGKNELLHLKVGTYELPPEDLYACTNLGNNKENCLRFEVKD